MEIHVSPQSQRFIEAQIRLGLHTSPEALLDALIEEKQQRKLVPSRQSSLVDEPQSQKRDALLGLIRECAKIAGHALTVLDPSDHDRTLYSERE
jgi:hypothetical protein